MNQPMRTAIIKMCIRDSAQRLIIETKYGLNRPFLVRFVDYVVMMLRGDLGVSYSIQKNMPISQMLDARLWVSIRLGLQAIIVGVPVGIVLGIVSALKKNTWIDTLTSVFAVLGVSIPNFLFAMLFILLFSKTLNWLPSIFMLQKPFVSSIMPTIALSLFSIAQIARFTRSEMVDVLGSEYMPVSYTHLDVYKRQGLYCAFSSRMIVSRRTPTNSASCS